VGKDYEEGVEEMKDFIDPVQGDMLLGAFRALSGIRDAIVLVNAPVGCHWGINFIERLCSIRTSSAVSALRERNVIFGSDQNLRKTIEILLKRRKNRYLILLAGNVPSIIGEDWDGIMSSLDFDIDYIAIDCGGYLGKMGDGYENALRELIKWIDEPKEKRKKRSVNIIGIPLDIPKGEKDIGEIRRCLKTIGVDINSVFPPKSIREIKKASNVDLNIVFGYGKALAIEMEKRWDIPYLYFNKYPYGINQTKELLEKVAEKLSIDGYKNRIKKQEDMVLKTLKECHIYFPCIYDVPIAVSADIFQARGISYFLNKELGMDVRLVSITSSIEEDMSDLEAFSKRIIFQGSWEEIKEALEKEDIKMIFGSDMEKNISLKKSTPFIPFSFPSTLYVSLAETPYMGFKGCISLVEVILNYILLYFS